jgi:hypothetical protein
LGEMGDLIEDGVLPHEVWDVLLDAIEQQCKAEDAKRRQAAKKGSADNSVRRER